MEGNAKDLKGLYELIDDIEIAMMTTRRADGRLVSRPMDTQDVDEDADLWFMTLDDADKLDEIENDPHVNLAYYNMKTREYVSVSGTARITRDRARIRELYDASWKTWVEDEGGDRNGGPNDPRFVLIEVHADSAIYLESTKSRPRQLFEIAKGFATGRTPDIGEIHEVGATG